MWGMVANWLSAQGGATASWEYNLPPNHYVIAQCALNMFINTTGSSAINVYRYTQSDGQYSDFELSKSTAWGMGTGHFKRHVWIIRIWKL